MLMLNNYTLPTTQKIVPHLNTSHVNVKWLNTYLKIGGINYLNTSHVNVKFADDYQSEVDIITFKYISC